MMVGHKHIGHSLPLRKKVFDISNNNYREITCIDSTTPFIIDTLHQISLG
jgi:hypothetical protein